MPLDADESAARRAVTECRSLCVLTGAGVSAESGVPTFRGPGGMWRDRDPMSLATPEAFAEDPKTVWEWYQWRRERIRNCVPNPGHEAIAQIERRKRDFLLVTQNVDGLHRRAGSRKVVEFHGNIWMVRCTGCGREEEVLSDFPSLPPRCPSCGALLRPGVVWFGERIPPAALEAALAMMERCDLLLVAETSSVVQPSASFAFAVAQRGGTVIEVNLEATPISESARFSFRGKTGEILPLLLGARSDPP
ncbi:MAG: SIR2 family NAD-dependent protein deacylase [Deltaproteobacteria bacterium]|nr:NAD-dependent deacylase [Candidatus Deferrimicrobiaceae bacterium]